MAACPHHGRIPPFEPPPFPPQRHRAQSRDGEAISPRALSSASRSRRAWVVRLLSSGIRMLHHSPSRLTSARKYFVRINPSSLHQIRSWATGRIRIHSLGPCPSSQRGSAGLGPSYLRIGDRTSAFSEVGDLAHTRSFPLQAVSRSRARTESFRILLLATIRGGSNARLGGGDTTEISSRRRFHVTTDRSSSRPSRTTWPPPHDDEPSGTWSAGCRRPALLCRPHDLGCFRSSLFGGATGEAVLQPLVA